MKLNNKNILTIVASGFLFVALFDGLPYGYFTLLRFVVCAVGIYLAYRTYEDDHESLWAWLFAGVAVLFNPIIPIYLQRETWFIVDLVVGAIFLVSIFSVKLKNKN